MKTFNIDKISNCENCGIDFNGEDIYQYFLNNKETPEEALKTVRQFISKDSK